MKQFVFFLLAAIVLALVGAVFAAARSWPKMSPRRRIIGVLLLVPHFLLIVCIVIGVLNGQAPMGSPQSNAAFSADVFALFILPVPALAGTIAALILFLRAR